MCRRVGVRRDDLAIDCGGGGPRPRPPRHHDRPAAAHHALPAPTRALRPQTAVDSRGTAAPRRPGCHGDARHDPPRGCRRDPHYITRSGPRSKILPELVEEWRRYGRALGRASTPPTKSSTTPKLPVTPAPASKLTSPWALVITPFDGAYCAPHRSLPRFVLGLTPHDYIGEHERLRPLGLAASAGSLMDWATHDMRGTDLPRRRQLETHHHRAPPNSARDVIIVPNDAGITGVRAWEL